MSALSLARALVVVAGGPLVLEAGVVAAHVSAAARLPGRLDSPSARRAAWAATALGVAAPWVYAGMVRPRLRTWGSTRVERDRTYPGDIDVDPRLVTTRAVTVQAPADEVWRWLVQIGQDRGGFYSYDWLENLAGCRIHSAEEIREEWQHPAPGDPLMMTPELGTTFAEVDPPHSLLIHNWGAYVVEPLDDHSCRLVARSNAGRGPAAAAYLLLIEIPHAVMERRMLLGIKQRAESARVGR